MSIDSDDAIASLRRALEQTTPETQPVEWSQLQIRLGDAFLARAKSGERDCARDAWHAYEAAAGLCRENNDLDCWAVASTGLAMAWLEIAFAPQGPTGVLPKAAEVCRNVIRKYPRERNPTIWAVTQGRLATILVRMGQLWNDPHPSRSPRLLKEALQALAAASEILTEDKFPDQARTLQTLMEAAQAGLQATDREIRR